MPMETFRSWIQSMVVFLLLMTLAEQLIPEEKYRKYVRLTMGLLLILIIAMPILKLSGTDSAVYRNFIQENIKLSDLENQSSGQMFAENELFMDSYETTVKKEITAYFESQSVIVSSCSITVEKNENNEDYGCIRTITAELVRKDNLEENTAEESGESSEPISVDVSVGVASVNISGDGDRQNDSGTEETKSKKEYYGGIPEEKINQWKQELSLQFGVDISDITLTIR